ncbi:hypothetical protein [Stratiformator vulcanicus]|uniref:Uncharacterized protein n=1 Tax=Stratiformator vulcanicus TaxID=2527980 RepID=A0A517QWI3_9PLAN|nr:hypothetical protein [Stratiformator vulcanicus]QDT35964.1 hypothetical protein Pan189_03190 [Stratiformator vulcanicus]
MKRQQWLANWGLSNLKLSAPFLEAEFEPQDYDRDAAWELYIELLTRVATQPLPTDHGDEAAALKSLYKLFPVTREILRRNGKYTGEFAKIAIPVLNQVLRPVTAKWHPISLSDGFKDEARRTEFRADLRRIRPTLVQFSRALADLAGVEDLTELEEPANRTTGN